MLGWVQSWCILDELFAVLAFVRLSISARGLKFDKGFTSFEVGGSIDCLGELFGECSALLASFERFD